MLRAMYLFFFFPFLCFSQVRDSTIRELGSLSVFKNQESYNIRSSDGKKHYSNLKYVGWLGEYLQVLDDHKAMFFLNSNGQKVKKEEILFRVCGDAPIYTYEIIQRGSLYRVVSTEFVDGEHKETEFRQLDSIPVATLTDIYFTNYSRKIQTQVQGFKTSTDLPVLLKKEGAEGILINGKKYWYQKVEYIDGVLKVTTDGLSGFLGISKLDYKELSGFVFGLAKAKKVDGSFGFIDHQGREYF